MLLLFNSNDSALLLTRLLYEDWRQETDVNQYTIQHELVLVFYFNFCTVLVVSDVFFCVLCVLITYRLPFWLFWVGVSCSIVSCNISTINVRRKISNWKFNELIQQNIITNITIQCCVLQRYDYNNRRLPGKFEN